eukprot:scaffold3667_cov110-Isochrysis_galbana.AAC.6
MPDGLKVVAGQDGACCALARVESLAKSAAFVSFRSRRHGLAPWEIPQARHLPMSNPWFPVLTVYHLQHLRSDST